MYRICKVSIWKSISNSVETLESLIWLTGFLRSNYNAKVNSSSVDQGRVFKWKLQPINLQMKLPLFVAAFTHAKIANFQTWTDLNDQKLRGFYVYWINNLLVMLQIWIACIETVFGLNFKLQRQFSFLLTSAK